MRKMNEQNYNNLRTSVKAIFENNTEIAKRIKNLVEHSKLFRPNQTVANKGCKIASCNLKTKQYNKN